jgi:glycosyltransferase involved in cell wall biosynthesis
LSLLPTTGKASGSELVAHHVNKYLISKGHHCRVILHQDKNINTPYTYEGVEVFGSKVGTMVDSYRWSTIIGTHLDFTQFTIIMAQAAKRPLVHFVHNDIPYSSILNSFGNVSAVYNSQWIADKIGYTVPGYVLHPPCNANDYDTTEKSDGQYTNDIDTLAKHIKLQNPIHRECITLVSLNERKGGYKFYEIAKAMPDKQFLGVVGSYDNPGPMKLNQMDIINKLMQLPNFTLVPNTPDILSTYRRTRVLLMPSDYESWGRTATEAMCSGIPVICTPTAGLKENCKDAAIYVGSQIEGDPGDAQVEVGEVKEWVAAIRSLDNPDTYSKMSLLCKARAQQLDPVKELEGLEQFLINAAKQNNRYREG